MIRFFFASLALLVSLPAHAELTLCNRTSYRVEAAIGIEKRPAVSTRGWFRADPGQCLKVIDGALDADMVYLATRTPPLYGAAPVAQNGNAELCIREGTFTIADARNCPVSQQAHFSAALPSDTPAGPTVNIAEDADYDDTQARLAGIQRLLAIAGYDAYPIDGIQGGKTQAALAKFLSDHSLPADAATQPAIFDQLMAAANDPKGPGFSWCNETSYTVMAAVGVAEMGAIVARGWYHINAGQCLRPDLRGSPHRIYSYAEAVDARGRVIHRGAAPLAWGGNVPLCTRDGKFELSNHKDCNARGLNSAGFAVIDAGSDPATTVHFKEP